MLGRTNVRESYSRASEKDLSLTQRMFLEFAEETAELVMSIVPVGLRTMENAWEQRSLL